MSDYYQHYGGKKIDEEQAEFKNTQSRRYRFIIHVHYYCQYTNK